MADEPWTKITDINFALQLLLIMVCSISLLLIISYYRLKRKSAKVRDLQQLEIETKEKALQIVAHQKDWLLKEIHHRVKNNLQVISSLLRLQSNYLTNEAALQAINDSRQRIHSMSLIHLHALGANGLLYVNMQNYLHDLVNNLKDDFENSKTVDFIIDAGTIEMDVPYAVPIGLIINEAVTNALKHAFPDNKKGKVTIRLQHSEQDNFLLSIHDNGIGLPDDIDKVSGSLGISLIKGLTGDIDARFTINNNNGTKITVAFVCSESVYSEHVV